MERKQLGNAGVAETVKPKRSDVHILKQKVDPILTCKDVGEVIDQQNSH